jgi:hypothetical protein
MDRTLTIRMDAALAEALQDEAEETGVSKGEIARQALEKRFRKGKRIMVMKKYFGSTDGAHDLSSNKAHRKTWGKKAK